MSTDIERVRRSHTVKIARWSATHPWRAITLWLAFVAASIAIGGVVGTSVVTALDTGMGQSGHAAHLLHDAKLEHPATENVLIAPRNGSSDLRAATVTADEVRTRMAALPEVARVSGPTRSAKGTALLVTVEMRGSPEHASDHVDPLLAVTKAVAAQHPGLRVEEAGDGSMDKQVNDQVGNDLSTAANFSIPVTLLILLVAFGAIVAAGAPVLLALSAVGAATGLSALVSKVIPDSGTTSSMILLMGMAVGVDYSLFYVKRARAERHRGADKLHAIEIAAETSGHSVVVSGVAVIVSMLGLFVSGDPVFSSLAAGSVLVVAVAVLGSLTVLPALLAVLGRGIDRPRVPVLWRIATDVREPRLWSALLRPALTHPKRTLAVAVVGLAAVAAPALGMTLHSGTLASLPDSIAAKQTAERIAQSFPGEQTTHEVVVRAPAAQSAAVATSLNGLATRLGTNPYFVGTTAARSVSSADGTVHLLRLDSPSDAEASGAKHALAVLRGGGVAQAVRGIPGASWAVGGDTAESVDVDKHASDRLPWVIAFVVVLTTAMMGWVFRSVAIALATAAMNLLSAGAAFGVLVLVFQHTWAQGLLGFHSTGAIINWIPLFTFAVLFGLSMDYHVFVLAQVREAAVNGLPPREAVRTGVLRSAGTVTSAAVVMVSVFAIFASLHMVEMKELGLSLAVAVLVDAVVVRGIVLPSFLTLMGERVWWPGRLPGGAAARRPSARTLEHAAR